MKNEHPAFFLEQDDIVNSFNYEGIAVIELQFSHFPDSPRLRVGSVTDNGEWLAVMVIKSTTREEVILHIIIVFHQRCLNCSECFQRHLMFHTYQLQHQGNS